MEDWHIDDVSLRRYSQGNLADGAALWSIEAHILQCEMCRARQATFVDPVPLERMRAWLDERADEPDRGWLERSLIIVGVRADTARLVATVPALSMAWFIAVAGVLAVGAFAARVDPSSSAVLLVAIPFLPLAGIAAAYGPRADPLFELSVTTPISGVRLLLLRASVVLTATIALATPAVAFAPVDLRIATGWMLPAFGLTLASLALSTVVEPSRAAATMAVVWAGAVLLTARPGIGLEDVLSGHAQLLAAGVSAISVGMLLRRRDRLDTL